MKKLLFAFLETGIKFFIQIYSTGNFSLIKQISVTNIKNEIDGGQLFVSNIIPPLNKEMICCYMKSHYYKCFIFNIENDNFNHFQIIADDSDSKCDIEIIDMLVAYFPETEEILVACQNKESKNSFYLGKYSSNYTFTNYGKIEITIPQNCEVDIFHLVYSSSKDKYSIVTDTQPRECINERVFLLNNITVVKVKDYPTNEKGFLFCEYFYSYDKMECLDEIPPGFYCNNTEDKTINQCHNNCVTCDKGPNLDNNNCLTCKNNLYFNLGNCVSESECTNGFFNDSSVMKCKCTSNNKCLLCDSSSSLCKGCNEYYPKIEDITNQYYNCYDNTIKEEGYFLNDDLKYEKCYFLCKKCEVGGDNINNHCTECIENYSLIKNKNNIENCYRNCEHYFYFNSENQYICQEEDICPDNYKLINGKGKCIDDCSHDNIYNYIFEYKNACYEECPRNYTPSNSNKCELKCELFEFYYNEDKTQCIDNVPQGYYCNDETQRTIARCHSNCKTCLKGGTNSHNNCEACPDSGQIYFYYGNCLSLSECINGVFTDNDSKQKCTCLSNIECKTCNEGSNLCLSCNTAKGYYQKSGEERGDGFVNCYKEPEGYFLKNEKYEKCYESCKSCTEFGDDSDNKCIDCGSNYERKNDNENDKNCYRKCNYYYYDQSDNNKYKCSESKLSIGISFIYNFKRKMY